MKENDPLLVEVYRQATEFQRIGNRAVRAAQEENRRLGVPNVYSRDGVLYFGLPNGEITPENPFRGRPLGEEGAKRLT